MHFCRTQLPGGSNPRKLLNGRQIRTKLDIIIPAQSPTPAPLSTNSDDQITTTDVTPSLTNHVDGQNWTGAIAALPSSSSTSTPISTTSIGPLSTNLDDQIMKNDVAQTRTDHVDGQNWTGAIAALPSSSSTSRPTPNSTTVIAPLSTNLDDQIAVAPVLDFASIAAPPSTSSSCTPEK
ncbi:hypothetical protein RRG08_064635 [Elysia crispata]|uniref:Uncharacterized protein n=1 Tax=Elysia crispata TaxID=231223 RepID=A0AAE1B9G7_9GAST|nr:hypothetical protein RRG08_064635 [Elysia crispata]